MALRKFKTMMMSEGDSDLAQVSWDLTLQGIVLTGVAYAARSGIDGVGITIICGFLAVMFLIRLVFAGFAFQRYFWGRLLAVGLCVGFCYWLLYQAENTRSGWYRSTVLQSRIEKFVNQAPAYVILADTDHNITCTSNNIEMLTGYKPEELVGQKTTLLMRPRAIPGHLAAVRKAVAILRGREAPNSGWMLQGVLTVGLRHKDGHIVPVRVYAGGIRWSADIQFENDTDLFAVFIPVESKEARQEPTTIPQSTPVTPAPPAPIIAPLVPVPAEQNVGKK